MSDVGGVYEILFGFFSILAVFGVPVTAIVCFIVFLVKYTKCGADEAEKKKLMKTNAVIFGAMGGGFIVSLLAAAWLATKTIAYM